MNFDKPRERPVVEVGKNGSVNQERERLFPELKRAVEFYRSMLAREDMGVNFESEGVIKKLEEAGSRNIDKDIASANTRLARKKEEGSWTETSPLAELLENMVVVEGEQAGLFGPDARAVRLGVFDDVKHGADVMLELPVNPDAPDSPEEEGDITHIIIDITTAESMETLSEKFKRIKDSPLGSVSHYISPVIDKGIRVKNAPRVILNIPAEDLSRFIKMSGISDFCPDVNSPERYKAAKKRREILEAYPPARGLLDSIDAQLIGQSIFEMKIAAEKMLETDHSEESTAMKDAIAKVTLAGIRIGDPFSSSQKGRDGYFSSVESFLKLIDEKKIPFNSSSKQLLIRLLEAHAAVTRAISRKAADRAALDLPANNRPTVPPAFNRAFSEVFS